MHDHCAPQQLNASANLHITDDDANDNRPQWRSIIYHFEISENAQIGSLVGTVQATDADNGLNATLLYNFTESSTAFSGISADIATFNHAVLIFHIGMLAKTADHNAGFCVGKSGLFQLLVSLGSFLCQPVEAFLLVTGDPVVLALRQVFLFSHA